jgi:hypothetical protein
VRDLSTVQNRRAGAAAAGRPATCPARRRNDPKLRPIDVALSSSLKPGR